MSERTELIFFLNKKKEFVDEQLDFNSFYLKVNTEIGWHKYVDIYSYACDQGYLEQGDITLTPLGENILIRLKEEERVYLKDQKAERTKLHNEAIMSKWKRKTFWPIFFLGLFGGIYSAIDIGKELFKTPKSEGKQEMKKIEKNSEYKRAEN